MKKLKLVGTVLFAGALILSGCGNSDKKGVDGKKDDPLLTTEDEYAGGSIEHGDGFGFTEFDLEIDVDGKDAIDIDYNVKEKAEADYENKLQNFDLEDMEAMDPLSELFFAIRITKDMPEKEVIQRILDFLQIDHYSKFELEVDFDDGTRLNIKEMN